MQGPVYKELTPVRTRQRRLLILRTTVLGLLAGSLGGIGVALARWLAAPALPVWSPAAVILAGLLLGVGVGLIWRRTWHLAAAAVDGHYQLKDRAATALAFVTMPSTTPVHDLQVRDAVDHLGKVRPQEVVPLRLPQTLPYALGAFGLAVVLTLIPLRQQEADAGPAAPLEAVLNEAQRIEEDLKEFEELAKNENNKELQHLVEELRQKVEEMKQPGVDVKEALAKLSEMLAAIAAQQAQFNLGLVDGQMQAIGEALSSAAATDSAGKALAEAKYDKAEKELEKIDDPEFDRKEAKALEEKLKQVAKAAADLGLGQISEAASEMAEGTKGGKGRFQKGAKQLAKAVRTQKQRKRVNDFLLAEIDRLNEGKSDVNRNGGAPIRKPYKSLDPSANWGLEISGNVQGNKTNLLSQRKVESITGNPGEGPSDVETEHSAEGRETAGRSYKDVYQKYQRMSEAVLDSEPIPLGHRQTIRKYFQLIRPQEAEAAEKEKK
jgi:hypothetical protein